MVPLLRELGLDVRWDVIKGGEEFFEVTKKFHNALHGARVDIGEKDFEIFMETSRSNLEEMETSGDIVFIHDPQPIVLVRKGGQQMDLALSNRPVGPKRSGGFEGVCRAVRCGAVSAPRLLPEALHQAIPHRPVH
jgi:hypothetical protein